MDLFLDGNGSLYRQLVRALKTSMANGRLPKGTRASLDLASGRGAWVQIARGRAKVNGAEVQAGDGAVVEGDPKVEVESLDASEVLVFDLT